MKSQQKLKSKERKKKIEFGNYYHQVRTQTPRLDINSAITDATRFKYKS